MAAIVGSESNTYQASAFGNFLGGPQGGGFEAKGTQTAYSTGGIYNHVFSPRLLTEVRVGVAHLRNRQIQMTTARTMRQPSVCPESIFPGSLLPPDRSASPSTVAFLTRSSGIQPPCRGSAQNQT